MKTFNTAVAAIFLSNHAIAEFNMAEYERGLTKCGRSDEFYANLDAIYDMDTIIYLQRNLVPILKDKEQFDNGGVRNVLQFLLEKEPMFTVKFVEEYITDCPRSPYKFMHDSPLLHFVDVMNMLVELDEIIVDGKVDTDKLVHAASILVKIPSTVAVKTACMNILESVGRKKISKKNVKKLLASITEDLVDGARDYMVEGIEMALE